MGLIAANFGGDIYDSSIVVDILGQFCGRERNKDSLILHMWHEELYLSGPSFRRYVCV